MDLSACTVLVVEDEYYLAADVTQALQRRGARVLGPFPDAPGALEALTAHTPDCAVVDVNLGPGPGFDVADRLRSLGVPFLFFTGYDREVIPARFADVGRLEKPVWDVKLLGAVERLCTECVRAQQ